MKISFGVYRGHLVADIPNHYLNWLLEQDWFCKKFLDLKEQTEIELEYRKKFDIVID